MEGEKIKLSGMEYLGFKGVSIASFKSLADQEHTLEEHLNGCNIRNTSESYDTSLCCLL